ncbi:MAG: amidohydrolase family protein [Tepidisphaeraceae bacterium]
MSILLTNAILVDIEPMQVECASIRLDRSRIVARGALEQQAGDEVVDCDGCVVIPGLVNGHTHLYSALAVGMPAPPRVPTNFHEILKYVWWRLDKALTPESNELSAQISALDALRCGTTTLIDHHASPEAIDGSLDSIESGIRTVGLRGVLCYELTDRNGLTGRDAGLAENRRYLEKCAPRHDHQFAALAGAHASFTLRDESLRKLVALADEFGVGVHIHVAEDPCDEAVTRSVYGNKLVDRLDYFGLLSPRHIFGHCTHLSPDDVRRINDAGVGIAQNTRSNMNNAVGYAPIGTLTGPIQLGTDGIGADLFEEARTAWFKSRDGHTGVGVDRVIGMLAASARRASQALGVTVGKLEVGAAADVVVTDYFPATLINSDNLAGHWLFALASRHVRHVMVAGRWALKDRVVLACDERAVRARAAMAASELWTRMGRLPC